MMGAIDNFYLEKPEPLKSCLLALRTLILSQNQNIKPEWKYSMPFFCINGKMLCYLWVHKQNGLPYIGIVEGKRIEHPALIMEKRARMKIMLIDPDKDIPVETIEDILKQALGFYQKTDTVKV